MTKRFFSLLVVGFLLISALGFQGTANSKEKSKKKEEDVNQAKDSKEMEYYNKGRAAYLLFTPKGFEKAIDNYNKAVELNPNFAPAYAGLGEVYSLLGHFKLEEREDYEDLYNNSYKNVTEALKLDSDSKECQRALALSYLHLRRLKEAESAAKRVLEKDPNDAEGHYILWAATGRNTESPLIKKAIELNPKLATAYLDLGKSYFYKKGDYARAISQFEKAVEIAPDSPQIHNYLGTALRTRGYLGKAVSEYQKAIELDPNYASAYTDLGIALFYMNKHDESIVKLKKAISLNPNYPDAYYYLARVFETTKSTKDAVANYETFISLAKGRERYSGYIASARESMVKLNGK
jgi:superkiller protein 3